MYLKKTSSDLIKYSESSILGQVGVDIRVIHNLLNPVNAQVDGDFPR